MSPQNCKIRQHPLTPNKCGTHPIFRFDWSMSSNVGGKIGQPWSGQNVLETDKEYHRYPEVGFREEFNMLRLTRRSQVHVTASALQ